MPDLRPVEVDRRQCVSTLGYVSRAHPEGLTVRLYETGTPDARRIQALDEAHERNASGQHGPGFCRACAENYVAWNDAL
jgi:hypothetical protein